MKFSFFNAIIVAVSLATAIAATPAPGQAKRSERTSYGPSNARRCDLLK